MRMGTASNYLAEIESDLGESWLPRIYRRVLKMRTRAYEFPPLPKNVAPAIHHTLLGIELKVGSRRMLCPDLATARYLAVLCRTRSKAVAIPYDITKISYLADELESSWHRMFLLVDEIAANQSDAFRTRLKRQLIAKVREGIVEAGAGPRVPSFRESTKQRREA